MPKKQLWGLNISIYAPDGFKKICRIKNTSSIYKWTYEDINESMMYDTHRSWVYIITVDDVVFKIGETANPLGIRRSIEYTQPIPGSRSRLGRYTTGDGTDSNIRDQADEYLLARHNISIYAKKCDIVQASAMIGGFAQDTVGSTQKDQEMQYLDHFACMMGAIPLWNKSRK